MQISARSRILSLAFAVFLLSFPAESLASGKIDIGTASGLTLSGYDKNDDLKWTIAADFAELEKENVAKDVDAVKNGKWNVRKLTVKTFSAGNLDVLVTSPTAVFFPKERRAEGKSERVEVSDTAKRFHVSGENWIWECDKKNDINRIAITNGVIVKLYGTDAQKSPDKELKISAKRLDITLKDGETLFTFAGGVKLTQGNIITGCSELEVLIPQDAHEIDESTHTNNESRENNSLKRIEKIVGRGDVQMTQREEKQVDGKTIPIERKIFGDSMELLPGENRFLINGNVRFCDDESDLDIFGDKSVGHIREENKKLSLNRIDIFGKPKAPVRVTTPSMEKRKAMKNKAAFSGQRLSVLFPQENETSVSLEGNVVFTDKAAQVTMNCDKLEADASRGAKSASEKQDLGEGLREIRANGKVKVTQAGTVCECENVEIDAVRELTVLTGNPRMSVPKERFKLSGKRCEIDRQGEIIRVFGDEKTPVRAEISGKGPEKPTILSGESLEVSREHSASENTIFDLVGKVRLSAPAEQMNASCDRLLAHYTAKSAKATNASFEQLQKIEALGNVDLKKEGVRIQGGKALMFNNIVVTEWMNEDDDGSDGKRPMQIKVLPGDAEIPGPRPQIIVPQNRLKKAFSLPLLGSESKKKTSPAVSDIEVSGDSLETIIGERRLRFWLRENVSFVMATTTCVCKQFEAELRRSVSKENFAPEAVFCREDVKISRDGLSAGGKLLELFPPKQIGFLSGNAYMYSPQFGKTVPGKSAGDRFILDLAKKEVRMEMDPKLMEGTPAQVARPRTTLPKNIRDDFSLKLKKHKNEKTK